MKKLYLYSMLMAAGTLASCSNDDATTTDVQNGGYNPTSYVSVNIVSTPESGTRAADANYVDGTANENKVSSVRFYFFDAAGNAVAVKKGSTVNYYNWTNPTVADGTETTGPVEKKLDAVLLIDTKEGDALPAQMVAVVNPEATLPSTSLSLSELRNVTSNYATNANATDASFVMCNSVYANAAGEEISSTKLTAGNFKASAELAKSEPVNIYVERNVAKVKVAFANNVLNADGRIQAKSITAGTPATETPITVDGKQVYIQFDKWNITGDVDLANLSKHIDPSYTGFANWNDAPYFRSYWAKNVTVGAGETLKNQYADYNANAAVALDGVKYCNENAEKATTTKNTQVIIPATLCDVDGNPYTITEFAGNRHIETSSTDLTSLKKAYLAYLENNHKHFYKEGSTYKEIAAEDIDFHTATAAGKYTDRGQYYVFACLSTTGAAKTWYHQGASGTYVQDDNVATELGNMPHAKVWKNGATYFFADINHINDQLAIVRNHYYNITLSAAYGLGTPVYDPSEVIYPEKPVDDDTYIAAQVKILSWRLVTNNVTLDWGK